VERPGLGELALEGVPGLELGRVVLVVERIVCVKLSSFSHMTVAPCSTSITAGSNL
jgi:hypothetical protein